MGEHLLMFPDKQKAVSKTYTSSDSKIIRSTDVPKKKKSQNSLILFSDCKRTQIIAGKLTFLDFLLNDFLILFISK